MTKAQREYFLREQLRSIQRELGEEERRAARIAELREAHRGGRPARGGPPRGRARARAGWRRPASLARARHHPDLSRLDGEPALEQLTGGEIDMPRPAQVLDEDHYDLEKIKDRILEYLAVKKLRAGAAGVVAAAVIEDGSAGRPSRTRQPRRRPIARPASRSSASSGRRASARRAWASRSRGRSAGSSCGCRSGGVHDEAEIRGHRRTYIGALPGRIIQALRRAEARDPGLHARRDRQGRRRLARRSRPRRCSRCSTRPRTTPSSTTTWASPFDLSQVLFIATANTLDTIPAPLRDRMEILQLSGYTDEEKVGIARAVPGPEAARGARPRPPRSCLFEPEAHPPDHPRLHARGRRPEPRSARSPPSAARSRAVRRGRAASRSTIDRRDAGRTTSAGRASSTRSPSAPTGRAWPPGWPGRRPAATSCSSRRR